MRPNDLGKEAARTDGWPTQPSPVSMSFHLSSASITRRFLLSSDCRSLKYTSPLSSENPESSIRMLAGLCSSKRLFASNSCFRSIADSWLLTENKLPGLALPSLRSGTFCKASFAICPSKHTTALPKCSSLTYTANCNSGCPTCNELVTSLALSPTK